MDSLKYPTGKFQPKGAPLTPEERAPLIARVGALPHETRAAVDGLGDAALDTPYRDGGWSPRQLVHHLADSHLNAYTRFKLALTEDVPTIKPYEQERWAELADTRGEPVEASLSILDGLHERWSRLLAAMTPADFGLRLRHPEVGEIDLDFLLQMYGWHGRHHVTQINELRARKGW